MILTSESVNAILWCDHSNETSLAVLSHGTIQNLGFYKNEIWDWSWILILGTLGSERVKALIVPNIRNCTDLFPTNNYMERRLGRHWVPKTILSP